MRFLSVCSGIEAASVAWNPLGWEAVAFSEIEKFPSAVLAHHYPDTPNLGDFTKIDTTTLGTVDILSGGTPCQAFSVAGLRNSLADARGNLSLQFVRLAHELAAGNGLRNAVWENVPGVLSTKDNAFGCFLGALVGADDAVVPSRKPADGKSDAHWKWSKSGGHSLKWPDAGMVDGPKGRAAWRVLDAQYFGLAQRRKRVIVVADFGRGADPASVLFERESVPGNPAPSREAGQNVAPTISARTKGGGGLGTDFDLDGGLVDVVATLDASYGRLQGASGQDANHGHSHLLPVAFGGNRTSGPIDLATAVNAHGGPHGRLDFESETFIAQPVCVTPIDMRQASRGATMTNNRKEGSSGGAPGTGIGEPGDPSPTLSTSHPVAVCITGDITHTLKAEGADASEDGTGRGTPIVALAHETGQGWWKEDDIAGTLRAEGENRPSRPSHVIAFSSKDYGADAAEGIAPTLRAGGHNASHANAGVMPTVLQHSAVRRLTPCECERLMGFLDGYTAIPWHGKPADQCPDGPRYKALGNSWAVPKFVWLGRRIAAWMPVDAANDNTQTGVSRVA